MLRTPSRPFVLSSTLWGSMTWEAQRLKEAARSSVAMAAVERISNFIKRWGLWEKEKICIKLSVAIMFGYCYAQLLLCSDFAVFGFCYPQFSLCSTPAMGWWKAIASRHWVVPGRVQRDAMQSLDVVYTLYVQGVKLGGDSLHCVRLS